MPGSEEVADLTDWRYLAKMMDDDPQSETGPSDQQQEEPEEGNYSKFQIFTTIL